MSNRNCAINIIKLFKVVSLYTYPRDGDDKMLCSSLCYGRRAAALFNSLALTTGRFFTLAPTSARKHTTTAPGCMDVLYRAGEAGNRPPITRVGGQNV